MHYSCICYLQGNPELEDHSGSPKRSSKKEQLCPYNYSANEGTKKYSSFMTVSQCSDPGFVNYLHGLECKSRFSRQHEATTELTKSFRRPYENIKANLINPKDNLNH